MTVAGVVNSQETPVVTLRRTWCFGTCPIYSLEIFQDGRSHYNGEKFVAVTGSQEAQISPVAVATLVEKFSKINYFDLKDAYETHQNPDGTSTTVSEMEEAIASFQSTPILLSQNLTNDFINALQPKDAVVLKIQPPFSRIFKPRDSHRQQATLAEKA
jgi:Domain of unknown function (DUF6438)